MRRDGGARATVASQASSTKCSPGRPTQQQRAAQATPGAPAKKECPTAQTAANARGSAERAEEQKKKREAKHRMRRRRRRGCPTGGETKNAAQAKDNSSADTLFMFQDRRHT